MKLKLSTLVIIVILLFVGGYWFVTNRNNETFEPDSHHIGINDGVNDGVNDEYGVTMVNSSNSVENFTAVTPIYLGSDNDEYNDEQLDHVTKLGELPEFDLAGNVRPDNYQVYDY